MIPTQLNAAYAPLVHDLSALKKRVDPILSAFAEEQEGQFSSRIKTVESIFDKAVLGNYTRLADIEDLFAATIIVPAAPIGESLTALTSSLSANFVVKEIRSERTRRPEEFIYDDLHYILSLKDSPLLLNKSILSLSFELQVKSYLQHGWAKATHDMVYKGSNVSWRASRVAAQTRAAIELIEAALAAGEGLLPDEADQQNRHIDDQVAVLELLLDWWDTEVPENRRRLAIFALNSLKLAKVELEGFGIILNSERGKALGLVRSLSVQQAMIILLLENHFDQMMTNLRANVARGRGTRYLLISSEMETISEKCEEVPSEVRFALSPV